MRFIGEPLTPLQAEHSFSKALQQNQRALMASGATAMVFFTVACNRTNQALGLMSVRLESVAANNPLYRQPLLEQRCFDAEVGIMLLPEAQQTGLALAALGGLCQKLQATAGLNILKCFTAEANIAAKKLVSRLGFVYCSEHKCYQWRKNIIKITGSLA
ncbi:hypothetical protein WG68_04710 [Arsukibacterium ikkense]|uniref:N-acetyltransferase domain-containing protein n=2 Tax=Arsukibacterium ikkense TaxID=336831 RepID=A0A0M2VAF3_9GAMM|nr:hypothetical protein WG68_04710 [Arsukibacterium ikkense]